MAIMGRQKGVYKMVRKKEKTANEWLDEKIKKIYGKEAAKRWSYERIDEIGPLKWEPHKNIPLLYDRVESARGGYRVCRVLTEEEIETLTKSALRAIKK